MSVTFTRAETVSAGQPISSKQLGSLAAAFNDRLRSGLGDGVYRIAWYLFSLFRQIRNPDEGGTLFPPQAEFFEIYQHLARTDANWPVAGAGEPEGVNTENPMGAYVFGNEAAGFVSENSALGIPMQVPDGVGGTKPPETASEMWDLRKQQLGARDPDTGAQAAPMLDGARNFLRLVYSAYSPYGNSYGGWLPTPELGSACASPGPGILAPPDYQYRFTATGTSVGDPSAHNATTVTTGDGVLQVTYNGSCPEEPTHVGYILRLADYFVIYFNDGLTVDILPRRDWAEGPYTGGGLLRHASGGQLGVVLGQYAAEFRGTDTQKQEEYDRTKPWNHAAFKSREFLAKQYRLAPQIGVQIDSATVAQRFTRFRTVPGSNLRSSDSLGCMGTADFFHDYRPGYMLTSAHVTASKVDGDVTLSMVTVDDDGNDVEIESLTFTADADGNIDELWVLKDPLSPESLAFRIDGFIQFTNASGDVTVEVDELFPYQPDIHDAAAILRLITAPTGEGPLEQNANTISDQYFTQGVIYNASTFDLGIPEYMNDSTTFEAARRLSKCIKILSGDNLVGYEVNADGKSVLYFKRYGAEAATGFDFDMMSGIAPTGAAVASGDVESAREYTVSGGSVKYAGKHYASGSTLTGISGVTEFTGTGTLTDTDGIHHAAPPRGLSNEWVLTTQNKGFFWSDSSNYKLDAYGRYIAFSDRCIFAYKDSRGSGLPADMLNHYSYGVSGAYSPEGPPGWRYAETVNDIDCLGDPGCEASRLDFYKSCQVYEPPVEIDNAEIVTIGGASIVKLTLTARLPTANDAPGSVAYDPATWDRTNLYTTQRYRTLENAVMEWLLWQNAGVAPSVKVGDHSWYSTIDADADHPWGSVFPHFVFCKLIPSPYADDNDDQQRQDTPFSADHWRQAWTYLRAMCEGFVDGTTSAAYSCTLGVTSAYDYTFGNLMFDAHGRTSALTAPSRESSFLPPSDIRPDAPEGYGPIANLAASVETYNQFANAINLLTRVRVMLPMSFQTRSLTGPESQTLATAKDITGADVPCSLTGPSHGFIDIVPTGATITTTGAWVDSSDASATQDARIVIPYCPGARTEWTLGVSRGDSEYRFQPIVNDALYACPESWRDMVSSSSEMLVTYASSRTAPMAHTVTDGSGSTCCAPGDPHPCPEFWASGGNALAFEDITESTSVCKFVKASDTLTVGAPPGGRFMAGVMTSPEYCAGESHNSLVITPALTDAVILSVPLATYGDEL